MGGLVDYPRVPLSYTTLCMYMCYIQAAWASSKYTLYTNLSLVMWLMRVMTTPHGTGAPINLCPETLMLPIGRVKSTTAAFRGGKTTIRAPNAKYGNL